MSETEQHTSSKPTLAELNANWGKKVAVGPDEVSLEEIKNTLDVRSFGEKVADWGEKTTRGTMAMPAYWREMPKHAALSTLESVGEGIVQAATIVVDAGVWGALNTAPSIYNFFIGAPLTVLTGNNIDMNLPKLQGNWNKLSMLVEEDIIDFVDPLPRTITDENGQITPNPHLEGEWATRGWSRGSIDMGAIFITGGVGGIGLGLTKSALANVGKVEVLGRTLDMTVYASKSLEYTKAASHIEDSLQYIKKSEKALKGAGSTSGEAAEKLTEKSQQYLNAAKEIAEGKRAGSLAERGYEAVNKKITGTDLKPLTRDDLGVYLAEKGSKKLDDVNKLADHMGVERFSADDIAGYFGRAERINTGSLLGDALQNSHAQVYNFSRFFDPFRNPYMEAPGFGLSTYFSYGHAKEQSEKVAVDSGKINIENTGLSDSKRIAKEQYEEALKREKEENEANKDPLKNTFDGASGAKKHNNPAPDIMLNGKDIAPIKGEFGNSASGAAIRSGESSDTALNIDKTKDVDNFMKLSLPS
jgi:hypothetical protein